MVQPTIPPIPFTSFVYPNSGRLTNEAYRFLFSLNQNTGDLAAGEVRTAPDSGLEGGGVVADGISISIAPAGVTNAMLRPSQATSVIGRFQGTAGEPADIQATGDNRVLSREGGSLAFRAFINGVSIGPTTPAPSVNCEDLRCDTFRIDQAPVAEVVVCTHTAIFNVNGTDYKFPCVAA
jgi:hypothetical protein